MPRKSVDLPIFLEIDVLSDTLVNTPGCDVLTLPGDSSFETTPTLNRHYPAYTLTPEVMAAKHRALTP